jgi:hypothetical protein
MFLEANNVTFIIISYTLLNWVVRRLPLFKGRAFTALQAVNTHRLPLFKNQKVESATHSERTILSSERLLLPPDPSTPANLP